MKEQNFWNCFWTSKIALTNFQYEIFQNFTLDLFCHYLTLIYHNKHQMLKNPQQLFYGSAKYFFCVLSRLNLILINSIHMQWQMQFPTKIFTVNIFNEKERENVFVHINHKMQRQSGWHYNKVWPAKMYSLDDSEICQSGKMFYCL